MWHHIKINALIWEEGEKSGRREKWSKKLGRREKTEVKNREVGNLTACSSPLKKVVLARQDKSALSFYEPT